MSRKQLTICIVPIKLNSTRVKNKNFRKIKGKKLYEHFFKKLRKTNFDQIYIDSDSKEVEKIAKQYGFSEKTLRNRIGDLKKYGIIKNSDHSNPGGQNIYSEETNLIDITSVRDSVKSSV